MVNANMFKGAFNFNKLKPATQPQFIPNPNYVAPAPQPVAVAQQPEDPEIAKMRAWLLKALVIIIGGSAILLIAWRIILKFI